MKRIAFALALVVSVSVGGCAGIAEQALNLPSGVLTQNIQNPITRDHLYRIENGLIVAVTALQQYKNLCENGTLANNCIGTVATLQVYVKRSRPLIRQLRSFVRQNDQINARVVFSELRTLLGEARNIAVAAGVQVPAMEF